MTITRQQLIKSYIDFFKKKGHKEIPNSSLLPENDPTVLFTTAGMHPLVPYLLGEKHAQGNRLVNVQRCIRTQDIDEVGDTSHHTFFEMLGNWSLGDYWKQESIEMTFEFLTKNLKIPKLKLSITCFKGENKDKIPKDTESEKIWSSLGINKNKIKFLSKEDNFWGPAGKTGPCGPDTEIFINNSEIWNLVFMQYNKTKQGEYYELKEKNVDTGMGVERTIAVLNNLDDNYKTELFSPIIKQIEKLSKKQYEKNKEDTRAMRIIADHIKSSVFILGEGVEPSNTEQGYVLRRLIRRAVRYGKFLMIQNNFTKQLAETIISIYPDYTELKKNRQFILEQIEKEENRFRQTLASGLRFFNSLTKDKKTKILDGKSTFLLYQSYGFPLELTQELAKEQNIKIDMNGFEKESEKHKNLSRTATKGRFKSGLADESEKTKKLHTAAHLLNQALRVVLKNPDITQRGSNITPERLRFDFNFPRKLTDEEIKSVENWVNKKIQENLEVKCDIKSLAEAKKLGAMGVFEKKYGEKVKVYLIGSPGHEISKEICAGPHVKNIGELGKFRIIKEESSSSGVRRIKAILE